MGDVATGPSTTAPASTAGPAGAGSAGMLPSASAARLPRARWLDPRLILGLLLVLLSVALGARIVAAADDSVAVWEVTRDLGPGTALTRGDLVARHVRLSAAAEGYIAASGRPPVGYVVVRPVGAHELLPRAAVATAATAQLRRLPLEVDTVALGDVKAGSVVDIYVVAAAGDDAPATASEVLADVTVADVSRRGGGLGAGATRSAVTVLVTPQQATALLDAQARGDLRLLRRALSGAPAAGDGGA